MPETSNPMIEKFQARADGIAEWIKDNAPYISGDQKHLDENTPECAYWHYGYMVALRDVINQLKKT